MTTLKILDLYAGLGGTAKGIQTVLQEKNIDYEYYAIEINEVVCEAHKKNNPKSIVICDDVKNWLGKVNDFDFIWASPPCTSHSKWNMVWSVRRNNQPTIDQTLWFLIRKFRALNVNFVIENVDPYYPEPLRYTAKIDRHCFWSSFPISHFDFISKEKTFDYMTTNDWLYYHQLQTIEGTAYDKRQALRRATHYSIAAGVFKQFLEPRMKSLDSFIFSECEQKA